MLLTCPLSRMDQSRALLPAVFPLLLTSCPHLDSWYLFSFPLSLVCPSINHRVSNQLSTGVLACEGGAPVLTMPVSCPLSSPVCQAFSDATVLQTLTRLAPQLRLARSLLLSFRAFLTSFHLQPLPWAVWYEDTSEQ